MKNKSHPELSHSKLVANLITGKGRYASSMATVQRSHRFPIHQFVQIENMAKLAECSVSAMINQVIEAGIEAIREHLPDELLEQINKITEEQSSKANTQASSNIGNKSNK